MKPLIWLSTTFLVLSLLLNGFADAEMVALNFDGGGSGASPVVDQVDAYTGMAGGGWIGPWVPYKKNGSADGAALVYAADEGPGELDSGTGNFLNVSLEAVTAAGGGYSVGRDYIGDGGGILPSQDHTVSFLFRVDESAADLGNYFDGLSDRYQMYDNSGKTIGSSATCRWIIGAYGLGDGSEVASADAGYWLCYDGAGDGTSMVANRQVNTQIPIQSGHTLSIQITNHADSKTWDATITDLATLQTFMQKGMGWRANTSTYPEISGYLQFCGRGNTVGTEPREFSVDAIGVVPEPGTWGLLTVALFWMGIRRRRLA